MSSYNETVMTEELADYYFKTKERLADLEKQTEPLTKQVEQQQKIIDDEVERIRIKNTTNAWKRKNAPVPVVTTQVEATTVTEAKKKLEELGAKIAAFHSKGIKLRETMEDINTALGENEEFRVWCDNLVAPQCERRPMEKPALIRRLQAREEEELAESMAKPGWARLTLDHRSPEGKVNRDAFYAHYEAKVKEEVVIPVTAAEVVPTEDDVRLPKFVRKLPWWYAKYNIPVDA
jgi:hypothetical protein